MRLKPAIVQPSASRELSRGLSLIELMIALTIGLIGVLATTQVYVVWEEYKRTTMTGSEAQQNGILALHIIQQDLHNAGYGIIGSGAMGCQINATNDGGATSYVLSLVPLLLARNFPAAGTDSVTVLYSTANGVGGGPGVLKEHAHSSANFKLENTIGFVVGNLVVAFQPGKPCTLLQTTQVNAPSATLVHNSGQSQHNVPSSNNVPQMPPVSPYAYTTAGYDAGSLLFNLGALYNVRYQIENNRLVRVNLLDSTKTEIAEGIVAIRAQYGIDTVAPNPAVAPTPTVANGDSLVDAYVDPRAVDDTPDHAAFGNANQAQQGAGWARVYSARVAIISRSSLREKTAVSPATLAFWPGGPTYTVPDRNYRYKVYHTIAPLRNLIWRRPGI